MNILFILNEGSQIKDLASLSYALIHCDCIYPWTAGQRQLSSLSVHFICNLRHKRTQNERI